VHEVEHAHELAVVVPARAPSRHDVVPQHPPVVVVGRRRRRRPARNIEGRWPILHVHTQAFNCS
jgi:hypothetical protein